MSENGNDPATVLPHLVSDAEATLETLKAKLIEASTIVDRVTSLESAAQERLQEIGDVATAALATKTQVTDEQAVIATKSSHIQDAQSHADRVRAEMDRLQTVANQSATEAEGQRTRAQSATDNIAELLASARSHTVAAETAAASAAAAGESAKVAAEICKALADKSASVEERIAAYEAKLAGLESESSAQLETITGLLPGATAAGLAHAFDDRRKTFLKPATRWQWLFVGSVGAIVLLALSGFLQIYQPESVLTWNELTRLWLARLPIAGALVWLALYASRESALAKRLEEDYGYKAVIAASFQGFEKQMRDISTAAPAGSPLATLCGDTLATIASPPGRIYDRHRLTVTPTSELTGVAMQAVTGKEASK